MMSKLQAVATVGVLLGSWVSVFGCSSDTVEAGTVDAASSSITAAEFASACSVDTDCTAIYEGDACRLCRCPSAAIATSARAAYEERFAALQAACAPHPGTTCNADCDRVEPRCNAGKCERKDADGG